MMPPVIVIGAPRSGTNMLRDVLTRVPGLETWPCDEINYIWRHGHRSHPSDEFDVEMATQRVQRYVRRRFSQLSRRRHAHTVVEKTCANSLRVEYIDRILPDARFVFIYRDGLDAVASAMQRWNAPMDVRYLARKARFVPPSDLPYHGARFVDGRLRRWQGKPQRPATWGPRVDGMDELMATRPLDEVCAVQWRRCVEVASTGLESVAAERTHRVAYEDFVRDPDREVGRLLDFLEVSPSPHQGARLVDGVSPRSIGKGRQSLTTDQTERLGRIVQPALTRLPYVQ